ncbi:MAG: hypothetical protein CVU48_00995 [Candidatus Cloacimonetes bacterium HGW-Cloacimonetes-1]|nr:MAG: hypothetical protein CVU48_00995 [Candidatus Cloacimonetes bacterium HGW-Cloacimonetes-1]
MRRLFVIILLALCFSQLPAIIEETGSLRNFMMGHEPNSQYDNWVSHIAEGIASANYNLYAPYDRQTNGFGDFRVPTTSDMTNWGSITVAFLAQNWNLAQSLITNAGYPYQVVKFNDTETQRTYYMLREVPDYSNFDDNGTTIEDDDEYGAFEYGWGIFIYNPEATRPVIVTVPHPNDDFIAPAIALEAFQLWNAKFMMINGAGREVKWTNVPPFYNSKSLSDPTRVSNHPLNVCYQQFSDLIRSEYGIREFSAQIHSYDWNRHVGYANVQVSAGNQKYCPNLPIRDLSNLKHDLINRGSNLMIPANTVGTHSNVYLNDFYAVHYTVHDFEFTDGENTYPVNGNIDLPGAEGNVPMLYTLSGWNDYDSYDPFFHIEMDELPNSYDETDNNYKWFYGWNESTRRWDYNNLFTNATNYYSRWYQDMDTLFDEMFQMNDGVAPSNPENLQVYNQSLNHITLKWDRSFSYDFDTYQILYSTIPNDEVTYQTFSRNNNSFLASQACDQINVTGLQNSNIYYFKIRALDKNGNVSAVSNEVMSRPAPANIVAMNAYGMDGTVRVYWTVSGQTNNQGFKVYRKVGQGDYSLMDSWLTNPSLSNSTASSFEWWDTHAANNTYYTYMISATNTNDMEFFYNYPSNASPRPIHTLTVRNADSTKTDAISFANNPFASDGQDTYFDVSKSNPSGSNFVWNAFWEQYWGNNGTQLSREIKADYNLDSEVKTWIMRVRSDLTSQPLYIEASPNFSRAEKLYLYDSGNGTWSNLLTGPYNFTVSNSNNRTMTLYWGNLQPKITIGSGLNRIYQGGSNINFTWYPQNSFLLDHVNLSIQNGIDSIFVASNIPGTTSSYNYMVSSTADMQNAKLVVDAWAVDGVATRYESSYSFGLVPLMNLCTTIDGWNMRSNIWSPSVLPITTVFGGTGTGYIQGASTAWQPTSNFEFGKGYWIHNDEPSFYSSNNAVLRDSISFSLVQGWNLIPNPHLCSYKIKDILFWINGVRYKFGEMINQQLISRGVYVYRNGSYEQVDTIEPYESFLIKYYGNSIGSSLITFIPYFNAPEVVPIPARWELKVSAAQAGYDTDKIAIGASAISSDAYDFRIDLPEPIIKPFPSLRFYLNRTAAADTLFLDSQLNCEYKAEFVSGTETSKVWDLCLDVPSLDPVTFTFDQTMVPQNYTITLWIGGVGHHLYNGDTFTFTPAQTGIINGTLLVRNFPVSNSDLVMPAISAMKVYPNPFNPTTNISFYLGKSGDTSLDIYNLRGQKVKSLFNGQLKSGSQTIQWNGVDDGGRSVASGVYFVRVKTANRTELMKMMLMK